MVKFERAVEICAAQFKSALDNPSHRVQPLHGAAIDEPVTIGRFSPPASEQLWLTPQVWVNTAKEEPAVHDGMIELARAMRENGEKLPREVELWLISLALGEIEPPQTGERSLTALIRGEVYHAIAALNLLAGMTITKNMHRSQNSKLPEKRCACDVVAEGFQLARGPDHGQLPSSFHTVSTIWKDATKKWRFVREEYRAFSASNPSTMWAALEREIGANSSGGSASNLLLKHL